MIKKYIVTLKNYDILEEFINDMENASSKSFIPDRKVYCFEKLDNWRIITYELTENEAFLLKRDPRVLDVEDEEIHFRYAKQTPDFIDLGINNRKNYWGAWDSNDRAWSLFRATSRKKSSDLNWGGSALGYVPYGSKYNLFDSFSFSSSSLIADVITGYEGQHVDIVIMDSVIDPNHPEIAVNSDGTGGTRHIEYPWYTGYEYVYTNENDDHGMNSAGVSAGNTCGFARRSNIYQITVFGGNQGPIVNSATALGYIKTFHQNKPINPVTGRKNPTVVNYSGSFSSASATGSYTNISSVFFNGTLYQGPFTRDEILAFGISLNGDNLYKMPFFSTSHTTAVNDFLNVGNTYFFASAGNDDRAVFTPTHPYYNNYLVYNESTIYYNRLSSFNDGGGRTIISGALSYVASERKAKFSNKGSRIDLWSPGEGCKSSSYLGKSNGPVTVDPRNELYTMKAYGGTSCASPVTAGIGACIVGAYPDKITNQTELLRFMSRVSTKDIISEDRGTVPLEDYAGDTGSWEKTNWGLWDAPNRVVYLYPTRYNNNEVYPRKNDWVRPIESVEGNPNNPLVYAAKGVVYPRRQVRYGKP